MIIITGASKNIGRYLFEKYSKTENVYGTFFSTPKNNFSLSEKMYKVDISNYNSVNKFYEIIKSSLSEITLINCAGISYNSFAHKSVPAEWKKVIDTNLIGTYYMIRAFLPIMREQKFGRIINFSSVVAQKSTPGVSAYAASKSALWGMTKSISAENGSKNITINNINLGYVNLGMGIELVPEDYQEIIKKQIPSKTFCEPKEIFSTIEYLRNNKYINGTSINLSGGLL